MFFICVFNILFLVFYFTPTAHAQVSPDVEGLVLAATDIRVIVARIIQVALGFLGIIALSLILYGGYLWMTSAGDEEKITKAKRLLVNSVIGLAIILSAFAIVQFVLRSLREAILGPPLPAPLAAAARAGGGALGSGIIDSHYPRRGQTDVPRNTRVLITFKDAVNPASLAATTATDAQGNPKFFDAFDDDGDGDVDRRVPVSGLTLNTQGIQMIKTADIDGSVRESDGARYVTNVGVSFTSDLRTFILDPAELLGSATEDVSYTVYLCGSASSRGNCGSGITLLNGAPAFSGSVFRDYQWSFETGTFIDITPPQVTSVIPFPDRGADSGQCPAGLDRGEICDRRDQPRNAMVQINFNEPILPTVASGITAVTAGGTPTLGAIRPGSFAALAVRFADRATFVAGQWRQGNQYQTSEFVSADLCGRNSCGQDVFCLPGNSGVAVEVKAATLLEPASPASAGIFDGIEDVAGNSLDGNRDGRAQGPVNFYNLNEPDPERGDHAYFEFFTTDTIDLTAPAIESVSPEIGAAGVSHTAPVQMTFSKLMAATTLNSSNLNLSGAEQGTGGIWDSWWTVESENLDGNGDGDLDRSRASIVHGGLWERTDFLSNVSSQVRDLYQNCYAPAGGTTICTNLSAQMPYCCDGQQSAQACQL